MGYFDWSRVVGVGRPDDFFYFIGQFLFFNIYMTLNFQPPAINPYFFKNHYSNYIFFHERASDRRENLKKCYVYPRISFRIFWIKPSGRGWPLRFLWSVVSIHKTKFLTTNPYFIRDIILIIENFDWYFLKLIKKLKFLLRFYFYFYYGLITSNDLYFFKTFLLFFLLDRHSNLDNINIG